MRLVVVSQMLLSAVLLVCTGCVRRTEDIKEDSRNLRNNTHSFIYNAIPEGAPAGISPEYSTAINTFSVNLIEKVYADEEHHGSNVVVSPFSVGRTLAVIAEATVEDAKSELLEALGGQCALDDARAALSELLYADKSVILQCADAVWVDSTKYSVDPAFRDTIAYKYGVETAGLDFGNKENAASTVNKWVRSNTNNFLDGVVEPADFQNRTAAVVANAIYFEADWTSPFDVSRTTAHEFAGPNGTVMVDMMESSYLHDTYKTDTYENAKLYYGSNGRDYFYLDVYMPVAGSIEGFLRDSCLAALAQNLGEQTMAGSVKMPKFAFTTECDLAPVLTQMGIRTVFDSLVGGVTGMVRKKDGSDDTTLYVRKMIHKAGIETDEEGTKAYAVTASMMDGPKSAGPMSPDVVFDQPFVYFIRAGTNGLVLFSGVVNSPNEE